MGLQNENETIGFGYTQVEACKDALSFLNDAADNGTSELKLESLDASESTESDSQSEGDSRDFNLTYSYGTTEKTVSIEVNLFSESNQVLSGLERKWMVRIPNDSLPAPYDLSVE